MAVTSNIGTRYNPLTPYVPEGAVYDTLRSQSFRPLDTWERSVIEETLGVMIDRRSTPTQRRAAHDRINGLR